VVEGQIEGLPSNLPAESPVEISFGLEADGRLEVTAKELSSGKLLTLKAKLEGVMSNEEVKQSKGLLLKKQVS
jgi:molecular chaperone DnaK